VTTTIVLRVNGPVTVRNRTLEAVPELVVLTEQLLAPVPGGTGRYTRELLAAMAVSAPPSWTVAGVTATHRDLAPAVVPNVAGPRALPLPRRGRAATPSTRRRRSPRPRRSVAAASW
jgi:hypothetical protein